LYANHVQLLCRKNLIFALGAHSLFCYEIWSLILGYSQDLVFLLHVMSLVVLSWVSVMSFSAPPLRLINFSVPLVPFSSRSQVHSFLLYTADLLSFVLAAKPKLSVKTHFPAQVAHG
jgi:hypothetical protein